MNNQIIEKNKDKTKMLELIKEYEPYFLKLISEKLGILIRSHQLKDLQDVIFEYCLRMNCMPKDFYEILRSHSQQSPLLEQFIAKITVGETYFFRDKNQMKLLKEDILPSIINAKREKSNFSIRIWSAGCSSGEEIYTIAILLDELIADKQKWVINLLGTDINTLSLQKAIKGEYNNWSLRSISSQYKASYFLNHNNKYVLHPDIKKLVRFEYLNLNDNSYPSILNGTNAQDLILCRNVLIYFDGAHIAKLMKKLNDSLVPGGFLLLGVSDPIYMEETNFVFRAKQPGLFVKPTIESPKIKIKKSDNEELTKNISPQIKSEKSIANISVKREKENFQLINNKLIHELLRDCKWHEILQLFDADSSKYRNSAFILYAIATALANLGKLEDSLKMFEQSLTLDSTNKHAYFNYALALTELNLFDEAEQSLKKTLFLDHEFVIAHYHLGLLLLRTKKEKEGLKSLRNALLIASDKNPKDLVVESQNINFGRLAEILNYEIDLYKTKEKSSEN